MNVNQTSCTLLTMCSVPILSTKIELSNKNEFMEYIKGLKYVSSVPEQNNYTELTDEMRLLSKDVSKELFYKIEEFFKFYKNELYRYDETSFKMVNSWATKTRPNLESKDYHRHCNSMFTGVYYPEISENSGKLIFNQRNVREIYVQSSAPTEYNTESLEISPETDLLILFPSYLYHKIGINNSGFDRYSIAFNYMPIGTVGSRDTRITYNF
mgnify:CR=1 FL=1